MLSLKDLQEAFIKALGQKRVFRREEELILFKNLHISTLRAYLYRLKDSIPANMIGEYGKDFYLGEIRYNWVQNLLIKEDYDDTVLRSLKDRINLIYSILVQHNLRLIISIAKKKYLNRGSQFLDLINEGVLGLMIASTKFNYRMNCKFSTYSIHWIKQRMYRCLNESIRLVKLPMHAILAMQQIKNILEDKVEDIENEKVNRYLRRAFYLPKRKVSLETDALKRDQDAPSLEDSLPDLNLKSDFEYFETAQQRREIVEIFSVLLPIEERIIRLRYGLNGRGTFNLQEISDMLKVPYLKVKRLENSRIRKLKQRWKNLHKKRL